MIHKQYCDLWHENERLRKALYDIETLAKGEIEHSERVAEQIYSEFSKQPVIIKSYPINPQAKSYFERMATFGKKKEPPEPSS
jgi:hypothetical protein